MLNPKYLTLMKTNEMLEMKELKSHEVIKGLFDALPTEETKAIWRYLRNSLFEFDGFDEIRNTKEFKKASEVVSFVVDTLHNELRHDNGHEFKSAATQNVFNVAHLIACESAMGDSSYLEGFKLLASILPRMAEEKKYRFGTDEFYESLAFDLDILVRTLSWLMDEVNAAKKEPESLLKGGVKSIREILEYGEIGQPKRQF